MYKSIIFILAAIFSFQFSNAQSDVFLTSEENINSLENLRPDGLGIRGFDNRYKGVKGSPLIFERDLKGIVVLNDNRKIENITLNIDMYNKETVIKDLETNKVYALDNSKILNIFLDNLNTIYVNVPSSAFADEGVENNSLFRVLRHDSVLTLLKYDHIIYRKADYQGAYSSDHRYDEFVDVSEYYVRFADDRKFEKIRLKRRSFMNMFPKQKRTIRMAFRNRSSETDDEFIFFLFSILTEKE
jgi:hypothetical protein